MQNKVKVLFKMITFPCNFQNGTNQSVSFYIGYPVTEAHPIAFQIKWLGVKGGNVSSEIMDSLKKIHQLSIKHNIPFPELCDYIIANIK